MTTTEQRAILSTLDDLIEGQRALQDAVNTRLANVEADVKELRGDVTVLKINLDHANSNIVRIDKKMDAVIALLEG